MMVSTMPPIKSHLRRAWAGVQASTRGGREGEDIVSGRMLDEEETNRMEIMLTRVVGLKWRCCDNNVIYCCSVTMSVDPGEQVCDGIGQEDCRMSRSWILFEIDEFDGFNNPKPSFLFLLIYLFITSNSALPIFTLGTPSQLNSLMTCHQPCSSPSSK
jgi:hypothetical protein